jgi:hypothetical protein
MEVERYLGGCRLACQRMQEGKLMAPYCEGRLERLHCISVKGVCTCKCT